MPQRTSTAIAPNATPAAHAPAQGNELRMQQPVFIQRKCADCEREEEVQRKPVTPFIQKSSQGTIQRMIEVNSGVELDTMGYNIKKSGNFYSARAVNKKSVHDELVTSLFRSPRIFKLIGNTSEEANASLQKHMEARMGIIKFAADKKYHFGAGDDFKMNPDYWEIDKVNGAFNVKHGKNKTEAINDLHVHPEQYHIACEAATALTMVGGGNSPAINDDGGSRRDWIPGDWGYIYNRDNMKHGGNSATDGENIIYVGLGRYWGHLGDGLKYQTLNQWVRSVDRFNKGTPSVQPTRKGPTAGLDVSGSDGEVTDIK